MEYWSVGVLECWQKSKSEFNLNWSLHYSITPPLHHSSRLPQGGKSVEASSASVKSQIFWSGSFVTLAWNFGGCQGGFIRSESFSDLSTVGAADSE